MTDGIHHITAITRRVQANVDFYVGFLGLRLVKRTAGYEDADQLHLFYGDAAASPGSLVTFLVWEDGAPGRVGPGQPSEITFAIPTASIGFWLTRALSAGLAAVGPAPEFGEPVLRLKDPDGIIVKLTGTAAFPDATPWTGGGVPAEHAIRRLRGATILTEAPDLTEGFLTRHFGWRPLRHEAGITRLRSASGDVLDIRDAGGFWPGLPGTGIIDHVAFRARDIAAVAAAEAALRGANSSATTVHDRQYFTSLYVREPGGALLELASDGPGMAVDEAPDRLGAALFVPPDRTAAHDAIRVVLPQFSLPGEERVIYRDLPFVHRFHTPENPDGQTLVLLHGSGGSEASLMPLAATIAPRATLLGVRGRSTEEGVPRWFRRLGGEASSEGGDASFRSGMIEKRHGRFDQADIAAEAEAFAAFVSGAFAAYGLTDEATAFVGHSNGANFLAAAMQLHPGLVRRAVLLRPVPVIEAPPEADLTGASVLLVGGREDPGAPEAAALAERLRRDGATVTERTVAAGHDLGPADAGAVRAWLDAPAPA